MLSEELMDKETNAQTDRDLMYYDKYSVGGVWLGITWCQQLNISIVEMLINNSLHTPTQF